MANQQTEMLTHDQIWGAMDRLAERSGLSPSGLAKASGLDPTKPAYRDGDVIGVPPGSAIRRGDRVVVKPRDGEVMVKELKRRTAKTLELSSLNPNHVDRTLAAADVDWIARIVWASQ